MNFKIECTAKVFMPKKYFSLNSFCWNNYHTSFKIKLNADIKLNLPLFAKMFHITFLSGRYL